MVQRCGGWREDHFGNARGCRRYSSEVAREKGSVRQPERLENGAHYRTF